MNLNVFKVYSRAVHSYLLVLEAVADGSEDTDIFVCFNDPGTPFFSSGSSSSGESSGADESGESSGADESGESSGADESGESSGADESGESSSSGDSAAAPLYQIYPNRTLVSIASLSDLDILPIDVPDDRLYRTSTVAMLFHSLSQLEAVLASVISDAQVISRLQNYDIRITETRTSEDPVHDKAPGDLYNIPGAAGGGGAALGESSSSASSAESSSALVIHCNDCDPQLDSTFTIALSGLVSPWDAWNGSHTVHWNDRYPIGTLNECTWGSIVQPAGSPALSAATLEWDSATYPNKWSVRMFAYTVTYLDWEGPTDPCDPTGSYGSHTNCSDGAGECGSVVATTCSVT